MAELQLPKGPEIGKQMAKQVVKRDLFLCPRVPHGLVYLFLYQVTPFSP